MCTLRVLNIASVATGSVLLMSDPNVTASGTVSGTTRPCCPRVYMPPANKAVLVAVAVAVVVVVVVVVVVEVAVEEEVVVVVVAVVSGPQDDYC